MRDTRQTVESQVLKNEQEMASSQQELNTQRNTLAGQYKEGEKAFGEAAVIHRAMVINDIHGITHIFCFLRCQAAIMIRFRTDIRIDTMQ